MVQPALGASDPVRLESRSAVHGLVSTSTAAVVQGFGQLLVLAILARYVSKTDFGLVTATLVVIGLGRQLAEALVRPALVQREKLTARDTGTAATLSWLFGFIAVALLWLGADVLARLISEPEIVPVVKVMAMVFLLQSPLFVAEGLVQRDFGFGRLAAAEVLSFLLGYTVVGVALALLGAGVWALVWAYVAQVLVKTVFMVWHRPDSLKLAFDPASARATLSLAGGFGSSKLLNYVALQGDYAVVAATMNAAAVGVYGRAYQIVSLPVMLMGLALDRVLFPVYARLQKDRARAAEHYSHSVVLGAMVIAPITMLFVVLAPEIVRLLLGPDWSETILPLQILAASLLFRMGYKLNDPLTKGLGVVYRRAWRVAVYAVAVICGAYIGSAWGLAGVAIGVSVAIIINFLLVAHLSLGLLSISWHAYAAMYLRGVAVTLFLLPLAWGLAVGLRHVDAGYFMVLIVVVSVVAVSWLAAALLRPDLLLGTDAQWLARLVAAALVPATGLRSERTAPAGVSVEIIGCQTEVPALVAALQEQLDARQIPLQELGEHNASRVGTCRAAARKAAAAPRAALYFALVIFSAVRQNGNNATRRITRWLAVMENTQAANSQRAVSLLSHGIVQELHALDSQGDLQSLLVQMQQTLHQHLPDVLVLVPRCENERRQSTAIIDRLRQGSCMSVFLLEPGEEKRIGSRAEQVVSDVAARWYAVHDDAEADR